MDTGSRKPQLVALSEVWANVQIQARALIDINLETNQAYLYLDDKPLIEVVLPRLVYVA